MNQIIDKLKNLKEMQRSLANNTTSFAFSSKNIKKGPNKQWFDNHTSNNN